MDGDQIKAVARIAGQVETLIAELAADAAGGRS